MAATYLVINRIDKRHLIPAFAPIGDDFLERLVDLAIQGDRRICDCRTPIRELIRFVADNHRRTAECGRSCHEYQEEFLRCFIQTDR